MMTTGLAWLLQEVLGITDTVNHLKPVDFIERVRYLSSAVTSVPGPMRYSIAPYTREPLNCFDPEDPTREVNFMKGAQVMYTTAILESVLLYYIAHVKVVPCGFVTADKDLSNARVENFFLPMLEDAGLSHLIRSSDVGNNRKTGKTKNHLQWDGGGFLIPTGAMSAAKMRGWSWLLMLKDEIDAWKEVVGKEISCPDMLTDDRCSSFWKTRKILRGGTPALKPSKIYKVYLRGDCRKYRVLCLGCGFPQHLEWRGVNKEKSVNYGFAWDYDDNENLVLESVRYLCKECQHEHFEHDKTDLFSEEHGAHWHPTKPPDEPFIRSYHLPAFYSPAGMQPWYKGVSAFLKGYNPIKKKVVDIGKYRAFVNNVKGEPFEALGGKVRFKQVSGHRRTEYSFGQVPNLAHARRFAGGNILLVTCQVDVHKHHLDVAIMGWTKDARCYLIEYFLIEDEKGDGCDVIESPAWATLSEVLLEREYTADNNLKYKISFTFIDASYQTATVVDFCSSFASSVYPILGRKRPNKYQKITEFAEWEAKSGTLGYMITVDHYKDRLAPVLRREWIQEDGDQHSYHLNVPVDTRDDQLEELTREKKIELVDETTGEVTYEWKRQNARNELWDLLVYGHALIEILAWSFCVKDHEMEEVDMNFFWGKLETDKMFFS